MNTTMYSSLIAVWLVVFIIWRRQADRARMITQKKHKRSTQTMDSTILTSYIGKECSVTVSGYATGMRGTVKEVKDGWLKLEDKKGKMTALNCDYISVVTER